MGFLKLISQIKSNLNILLFIPKFINFLILNAYHIHLYICHYNITEVVKFLKYSSFFNLKILNDIAVIDFIEEQKRFKCVYNFSSIYHNLYFFVHFSISSLTYLDSIKYEYLSANWLEREAWDMFGIFFLNNSDLRRILTDYGFKGYPLRKDFPLTGYIEVRYDDELGYLVYEPVELTQELRFFHLNANWEHVY